MYHSENSKNTFLTHFLTLQKFPISDVAISSVVPRLTCVYEEAVRNIFHIDSFIINHKNCGIELDVDTPEEVGTDRICNVVAAIELVGTPAIIGDIGSATNYDVEKSYLETIKSCENLNTRLLNLKKINKSLDSFISDSSQLNWDELQNINLELSEED